jgi:TrmH family RNA methyltransferase
MSSRPPITSTRNPTLRELRKLHERKHRERSGLFIAEGEDMLAAAIRHDLHPRTVLYDSTELSPAAPPLDGMPAEADLVPVTPDALRSIGSLGSGSRLIAVFEERWRKQATDVAVYLHEVADPGNVGAVLRSTQALAGGAVLLSPGTADPFGPKAVRASMGAVFGVPLARASFHEARAELGDHRAIALVPAQGASLQELQLPKRILFCLGSERTGLPEEIVEACDEIAQVPLEPSALESLNVAMTATLCLYEYAGQHALHRLSSPDA